MGPGGRAAAVAMAAVALASAVRAGPCSNDCSRNGICNVTTRLCDCFEGFRGYDCRDRVCPFGAQWLGYAHATDQIHNVQAECSTAGTCDKTTGTCKCLPMYEGFACQYFKCADDCNGHGRCMSMRQAATEANGHSLFRSVQYDTPWDADLMRGCVCDYGWEGYDCSLRSCPKGDDPLTAGQTDEVQLLNCSCPYDECTGDLVLSFFSQSSPRINATAVLSRADERTDSSASGVAVGESLESKLEVIRPIEGVEVTTNATTATAWHGSKPICAPASQGGALTRIRFNERGGDAPPLEVTSSVMGKDSATGATAPATVQVLHDGQGSSLRGTTERAECSDRGTCNHLTGDCMCFANYFASDGDGSSGSRPDCGHASVNVTDCPNVLDRCSNRGVCDHQRVINGSLFEVDTFADFVNETFLFKCNCYRGYEGGDCAKQVCPSAPAWFDEASSDNVAHALATCSNMGLCDSAMGQCRCRPGFTGQACERLECPVGSNGLECSGRARCLTLGQAAERSVRHGWRQGSDEVQEVRCSLTSGAFYLELGHHRTFPIDANASEALVRSLIEEIPSVGFVDVRFHPGPTACLATSNTIRVAFTTHDEDTAQLVATSPEGSANPQLNVTTVTNASRITYGATQGDPATWDADKLTLCDCDGRPDANKTRPVDGTYAAVSGGTSFTGYTGAGLQSELDLGLFVGPTCELRPCPHGPDPLGMQASIGALESQVVHCVAPALTAANTSTVILSHMGQSTPPLTHNTTAEQLKVELERLSTVGVVTVTMTSPSLCSEGVGTLTNVTFQTEYGDLPLLRASVGSGVFGSINVTEAVKGTRQNIECNGRGVCDASTGLCRCFSHYVSGDGTHSVGRRGDCGALDELFRNGA